MAPLRVFYNLSELYLPDLSHAWRSGVPEECEARFNAPDSYVTRCGRGAFGAFASTLTSSATFRKWLETALIPSLRAR